MAITVPSYVGFYIVNNSFSSLAASVERFSGYMLNVKVPIDNECANLFGFTVT